MSLQTILQQFDDNNMELVTGQYDETTRMTSYLAPPKEVRQVGCEQKSPFLNFPMPVQELIYDHLFEEAQYEIKWCVKNKSLTYWKYITDKRKLDPDTDWAHLDPDSELWQGTFVAPKIDKWTIRRRALMYLPKRRYRYPDLSIDYVPSVAAMLMVCRDAHYEATKAFYKKQSFSFSSMKLVDRFMCNLTELARNNIQSLFVKHEAYGDTRWPRYRRFKTVHDQMWSNQLMWITLNLEQLKEFYVYLKVNEREIDFTATSKWARPLLVLHHSKLNSFRLELDFPVHATYNANCRTTVTNFGMQDTADAVRKLVLGDKYTEIDYLKRMPQRKANPEPPEPRFKILNMPYNP